MTSKQRTVIWIGLFIVALNLVIKWPSIKALIFGGSSASASTKPPQNAGQAGGAQPTPQPNASPTPSAVQVA